MSLNLNYDLNTYLAVSLSRSSPFFSSPAALATVHPAVAHVGQVGATQDVQLYSVPKFEWERAGGNVVKALEGAEGVGRVDIQELQQRAKRDEL